MKKKTEIRLYNIIMPVWMFVIFMPQLLLIILPANWGIDFLVLWLTMKALRMEHPAKVAERTVWLTWIFGFIADIGGMCLMMIPEIFLDIGRDSVFYGISRAIYNPFDNVAAFVYTTVCIAVTGVLIYLFNRWLCVPKYVSDKAQIKRISLCMAIFTAPYLFYLPAM
ncbi:MAG: hypothetical protein J6C42_13945 [Clostridia bacterium]|nr:hypothetical protein [Clostridia bacterium]